MCLPNVFPSSHYEKKGVQSTHHNKEYTLYVIEIDLTSINYSYLVAFICILSSGLAAMGETGGQVQLRLCSQRPKRENA